VATFRGSEYFCYDLSQNPIQSSSDEITLSFKTWQRNGLLLHTGKSADYVNLALKAGAVSLVINLGSGAFEAIVEPVNGKFNDNSWHDIKVTRNLRQVTGGNGDGRRLGTGALLFFLLSGDLLPGAFLREPRSDWLPSHLHSSDTVEISHDAVGDMDSISFDIIVQRLSAQRGDDRRYSSCCPGC